jgi:hypothetical protein
MDPRYVVDRFSLVEFLRATYKDWPEPQVLSSDEYSRYSVHLVAKPLNVSAQSLISRVADVAAAMNRPAEKVTITLDAERNAFVITVAQDEPAIAWFSKLNELPANAKYDFTVGLDPFDKPLVTCLIDSMYPHILVSGGSGSGKSIFVHSVLAQLLRQLSPSELQILFCDAGHDQAAFYSKVPHLFRPTSSDNEEQLAHLADLVPELKRRSDLLFEAQVPDRAGFLRKHPDQVLPVILLVVNEAGYFTSDKYLREPFLIRVGEILKLGRKYGMHVMFSVQRPAADTLGLGFLDALSRRVVFRLESPMSSKYLLDSTSATSLRGQGSGILRLGSEIKRFQALYLPDELESVTRADGTSEPSLGQIIDEVIARWGKIS